MPGRVWFFDFIVITIETLVLVFMGGLTSEEASRASPLGFVGLLLILLAVDVAWVLTQSFLARMFPSFERPIIPWTWAILNICLATAILLPRVWIDSYYSAPFLIFLGVTNLVVFVVDVVFVDYFDVI